MAQDTAQELFLTPTADTVGGVRSRKLSGRVRAPLGGVGGGLGGGEGEGGGYRTFGVGAGNDGEYEGGVSGRMSRGRKSNARDVVQELVDVFDP